MKSKIALLLLLTACATGKYFSYDDYQRISIGEQISEVQVQFGRPYEVKELGEKRQEYIYMERIPLGDAREAFRRYILIVEDEKVIDKKLKEEVTSPIQFIGP
ncbi:MAG: hypothetical protein JSR37_00165 [Verrucomicrobia bacterium]|nr:hypothetical protein [Verrucomicrobiota bacterium]MBS0636198.1 hypothetical protein [Verrucomicrobiota bacterium]